MTNDLAVTACSDGRHSAGTDDVGLQPHERDAILSSLPLCMLAEEGVVSAAVRNIDETLKARLKHAMAFQLRCAMIGDVDGVLASDQLVESLICQAAREPAAAHELKVIKRSFKEAWRSANRLRNMKPDVDHRDRLVSCIVAGDEPGALATVRQFYAGIGSRL